MGVFHIFSNCTNGTCQIAQTIIYTHIEEICKGREMHSANALFRLTLYFLPVTVEDLNL